MKIFIGGAIALLLGIFSISVYYEAFLKLMMAIVPATLILGGCLMIYLGREHFLSDQAEEPVAEEPVAEATGLVGNTDSKVFHTQDCKFAQSKKCTDSFAKREDAVQAGYKPCGSCKP